MIDSNRSNVGLYLGWADMRATFRMLQYSIVQGTLYYEAVLPNTMPCLKFHYFTIATES